MKKIFIFMIVAVTFITCSCQKKSENVNLKTLNISFNMDPKTLDPRKSGDIPTSATLFLLYAGLTETAVDGSIVPSIAESIDISKDQKTYIFHIRKDAKWSDGAKITAFDFEKSWKKTISPNFPAICPNLFFVIKNAENAAKGTVSLDEVGIYALDENTLVVNLTNPTPYFLSLTSFCIFFPVPSHIEDNNPNWEMSSEKNLVCSGPFKLKEWKKSNELTVEKNPLFFNSAEIKLDAIKIFIINDENTAFQMYENNKLDWIGALLSPLPLDAIPTLKKHKEHVITPTGGTSFCSFNIDQFPFNNQNIRKAFGLAINRQSIIDNITQLDEKVATRCLPPILSVNKQLEFFKDNDLENAVQLFEKGLQELNVKREDIKITLTFESTIIHKKVAEALQSTWTNIFKVPIALDCIEKKWMMEKMYKHQYQAAISHWLFQYNDAMNILDRFKYKANSKNYPGWENKRYIELLDYSKTLTDQVLRTQVLEKAEEILLDDMALSPIYHHNYIMLIKPYIKGLFIGQVGEVRFDKIDIVKQ